MPKYLLLKHYRGVPERLPGTDVPMEQWTTQEIEDHIAFLRNTRRLPSADKVEVRLAPAKEITPERQEGERVVFRSHFLRGIGLPASAFFRS